ncbi:MAG: hypothetical protein Fur006_30480 [Coleofasciculaceae cyanobacterium]
MSEDNVETIWVVVDETHQAPEEDGSRSVTSPGNPYSKRAVLPTEATKAVQVSTQKLEAEMSKFLQIVSKLFSRAEKQVNPQSGLKLDEIEVSVEINGEGEVKLLGTGGKAGTKGGITLRFKRTDA